MPGVLAFSLFAYVYVQYRKIALF